MLFYVMLQDLRLLLVLSVTGENFIACCQEKKKINLISETWI